MLRIDDVEYQHVLGLRLNVWTSIVLFVLAAIYFVVVGRPRPGRETVVYTDARLPPRRAATPRTPTPTTGGRTAATRREAAAGRTRAGSDEPPDGRRRGRRSDDEASG